METKTCSRLLTDDALSLSYTYHATERTKKRRLPTFSRLPESATIWDTNYERGSSRWLLDHGIGTVCLVISDIEPGVVITAYDPRRCSDWQ